MQKLQLLLHQPNRNQYHITIYNVLSTAQPHNHTCVASLLPPTPVNYTNLARQETTATTKTPKPTCVVPAASETDEPNQCLITHSGCWQNVQTSDNPQKGKLPGNFQRRHLSWSHSKTVSSHRGEWVQKQQSSQYHRPEELPPVIKYKVRCF